MEKIISLIASIALVAFILWWFFGKRSTSAKAAVQAGGSQHVEVTVDGGYQPQIVELKAGVPATIVFRRKDPSACLEEVHMPDFGVSQKLALGQKTAVDLGSPKAGTYKYTCGMQMFSGQVVVK